MWLPELASQHGGSIDQLFTTIFWVTGVVLLLVQALLIFVLIRYRRRAHGVATYSHGSIRLELLWTVVPAIILLALSLMSRNLWATMKGGLYADGPRDAAAWQVRVIPQQYQWNITYPGQDARFDTPDDVQTINELRLPVNREVLVRLKSRDVIHSFFLPEMRVKQDALPNAYVRVRFKPIKEGRWEIVCAELCGLGHYRMRGFVTVQSDAALEQWLDERRPGASS